MDTDRTKDGRWAKGNSFAGHSPGPMGFRSNPRPGSGGFYNQSAQAILVRKSKAITKVCIQKALAGDVTCIRICMERLCPPMTASMAEFEDRIALLEAAREKGMH
jgi:hypothetical protein